VLVVVSDHGFKSGEMRPLSDSRIGVGQAVSWHRLSGVIAVYGPGIKPGHEITDASVLDVAPTVLNLLGLPVGKTMPGRALTEMLDDSWTKAHPVRTTAKYDSLFVRSGGSPAASATDEALKEKLQSLGYLAGGNASLVNMANFYQTNRRFDEAAETWKQLIAKDAKDLGARIGLASAYLESGKQDSAVAELRVVLGMDPHNLEAMRSLATIYVRSGDGQKALATAEDALRTDPYDGQSHLNRGLALELLGRRDQAVEEYRQATRLAPDLAEPFANLAQVYVDKGMVPEALVAAQRAVDLAPDKSEMRFVLGQALEASSKGGDALVEYMIAVKLNPRFAPAYVGACGMLVAEGKADSAVALCDRALAVTSDYPQYLHNMKGMAYLGERNFKGARREFEAALAVDGTFVPARINLAKAYIGEGKTGDARRELQAVLASQPSSSEARSLLNSIR
jgi:tetratricopeptide (TPR) repeat protein